MSRYIDADVLIDDLIHNRSFYPAIVSSAIKNTPTADVVEVVRCKDCEHRNTSDCSLWYGMVDDIDYLLDYGENFYCSLGKRSENND